MLDTKVPSLQPRMLWFDSKRYAYYYKSMQGNWWQILPYDDLGLIGRPLKEPPCDPLTEGLTLSEATANACEAIDIHEMRQLIKRRTREENEDKQAPQAG